MSDRIDLLNRENFIGNVIKVVSQMSDNKKGCCFAIEGGWGIGKTFVIEEVEKQLKDIQSEETNSDRYFVFHYNCWQYDYYEEPSVAIISAMTASVQEYNNIFGEGVDNTVKAGCEWVIEKLKEIAGILIENRIGVNLISIAEEIKEKRDEDQMSAFDFDQMFNFSQTIEKVRRNLQEIAKHRTIVLVVDELDRCIPGYAIKVLERLHHIFYGLENIVVIMAIDRTQLEHSVEEMFGAKNDSGSMDIEKYLKKFIDFSMVLDNGKVNESLEQKYDFYFQRFEVERAGDNEKMKKTLSMLLSEIDIRRQEKIIEKAHLVHSLICNENVHISVLVFEVMYEIMKIWDINMSLILEICDDEGYSYDRKTEILKNIMENAYENFADGVNISARRIVDNLYGDIYFYILCICNYQPQVRIYTTGNRPRLDRYGEIVRNYCEFCEIIK